MLRPLSVTSGADVETGVEAEVDAVVDVEVGSNPGSGVGPTRVKSRVESRLEPKDEPEDDTAAEPEADVGVGAEVLSNNVRLSLVSGAVVCVVVCVPKTARSLLMLNQCETANPPPCACRPNPK